MEEGVDMKNRGLAKMQQNEASRTYCCVHGGGMCGLLVSGISLVSWISQNEGEVK